MSRRPLEPAATPHLGESLGGLDFALRAHGFDLTAEAMARQRSFDGAGRDRILGGYIRALLHSSRRWHTIFMFQVQAGF